MVVGCTEESMANIQSKSQAKIKVSSARRCFARYVTDFHVRALSSGLIIDNSKTLRRVS